MFVDESIYEECRCFGTERRRDERERERRREWRGFCWRLMRRRRKEGCVGKSERKELTCSYDDSSG
jgi:hypothetical protein